MSANNQGKNRCTFQIFFHSISIASSIQFVSVMSDDSKLSFLFITEISQNQQMGY